MQILNGEKKKFLDHLFVFAFVCLFLWYLNFPIWLVSFIVFAKIFNNSLSEKKDYVFLCILLSFFSIISFPKIGHFFILGTWAIVCSLHVITYFLMSRLKITYWISPILLSFIFFVLQRSKAEFFSFDVSSKAHYLLNFLIPLTLLCKSNSHPKYFLKNFTFLIPVFGIGLPLFLSPQEMEQSRNSLLKSEMNTELKRRLILILVAISINLVAQHFLRAPTTVISSLFPQTQRFTLGNPWLGSAGFSVDDYINYPENLLLATTVAIYHLSLMYFYVGFSGVVLMLFGFRPDLNFNQPLMARTYSEFLSRILHIYKRILIFLFFLPIFRLMRLARETEQRFVAIFLAVFFGGLIIHFPVSMRLQPNQNISELLTNYFHFIPYFFFIAVSSMISNQVESQQDYSDQSPPKKAFRILIYFLIYSLIGSLGIGLERSGRYIDNWRIFTSLIGIG